MNLGDTCSAFYEEFLFVFYVRREYDDMVLCIYFQDYPRTCIICCEKFGSFQGRGERYIYRRFSLPFVM